MNFKKAVSNFLIALASQVPALGVAAAYWQNWLANPLIAATLALIWELLIIFWVQLGKPAWEVIWVQELKQNNQQRLTKWLRTVLINLVSAFKRSYLNQVKLDNNAITVRGLKTPGRFALDIEQVFVEMQIAPSHMYQVTSNPLLVKDLPGRQTVWTFLRRFRDQAGLSLAILGPPGCGKTTLLKHIALNLAARGCLKFRLKFKIKKAIPLLLFLREHVHRIVDKGLNLAEAAQAYYADPKRYPDLNPPEHWFACQLQAGRCLVLLDGLDEVLDNAHRETIARWVDRQIANYPRCRFILTARPNGYAANPLERAHVLEVLAFSQTQVETFIRGWYLANKRIEYGENNPAWQQEARRGADELLNRLSDEKHKHIRELTVNPLLLTMIANVHNFRGVLPDKRVNLYTEICEVFLGLWQQAKGVAEKLDTRAKLAVLQPLAAAMMDAGTREMSADETRAVLTPPLIQVGVDETEMDEVMANLCALTSGLLIEKEDEVWSFAHWTFQEYLCAAHWKQTGQTISWASADWQKLIDDSWWHETLRLFGALTDADPVLRACLELNTEAAIELAREIESEAHKRSPAIREQVARASAGVGRIKLRDEKKIVSPDEARKEFGLDNNWRPLQFIQNDYVDSGETIFDRATGLTWQKSGSDEPMPYNQVPAYIDRINKEKLGGFENWRLPTVPELVSLLEPEKKSNGLYIDPVFDKEQWWCWTCDQLDESSSGPAFLVGFTYGYVHWDDLNGTGYVRLVRSGH